MSNGNLCLKWNNHSAAFLNSIHNIQSKEKFCDATIACQGKYFPVHRMVLSTCSEYFDEILDRMQCQHPYIIFKDIEASNMELLLNYMYQGEIRVLQENLPSLIKAAEALKIKGLAVSDDLPSVQENSNKKRNHSEIENTHPSKADEKRRRKFAHSTVNFTNNADMENPKKVPNTDSLGSGSEILQEHIKKELLDVSNYDGSSGTVYEAISHTQEEQSDGKEETLYLNEDAAGCSFIKTESRNSPEHNFEDQNSTWPDFSQTSNLTSSNTSNEVAIQRRMETFERLRTLPNTADATPVHENSERESSSSNKTLKLHYCTFCSYKSYIKTNVRNHIRFKHTGEKPFQCHICVYSFATKLNLNRHLKTHSVNSMSDI